MRAGEKGLIRFVVFSIATILAACGATRPEGLGRPSTTPTIGHPSPGITEPSPLASLPPTSVLTVVPSPTLRFSVIDPDGYSEYLNGLMETNGGCEIPCWWGITPGLTRWEDAAAILGKFVDRIDIGNPQIIERAGDTYSITTASALFTLPDLDKVEKPIVTAGQITLEIRADEVIELIIVQPNFYGTKFTVPNILSILGVPAEVSVRYLTKVFEEEGIIILVMHFPDYGVSIRYNERAIQIGQSLQACFDTDLLYTVYLWPPEMKLSVEEVMYQMSWISELESIQDILGITYLEFYETYEDADQSCIQIEVD